LATSTGQLYGSYTLTASAGNNISGMQLIAANGATNISEVIFQANTFQIWNGTNTSNLFSVSAGVNNLANVVINGNLLVTGTITASKLNITDLSAISANLGSITVGTANIQSLAVGTGNIAGSAVNTIATGFVSGDQTFSAETVVASATLTTSGGLPIITAAATWDGTTGSPSTHPSTAILYRKLGGGTTGGTQVLQPIGFVFQVALVYSDATAQLSPGTYSYYMTMQNASGGGIVDAFVQVIEVKR
jgi:hypothetical protein